MPDPANAEDLPYLWLSVPSAPKPEAYRAAVERKIRNARHAKVLALANVAEDMCRKHGMEADELGGWTDRAWHMLARQARQSDPSPETRAAVIDKVRADLAAPYRAKGRG